MHEKAFQISKQVIRLCNNSKKLTFNGFPGQTHQIFFGGCTAEKGRILGMLIGSESVLVILLHCPNGF